MKTVCTMCPKPAAHLYYRSDKLDVAPLCLECASVMGYETARQLDKESAHRYSIHYERIVPVTDYRSGKYMYNSSLRCTRIVTASSPSHAVALLKYQIAQHWQEVTVSVMSCFVEVEPHKWQIA